MCLLKLFCAIYCLAMRDALFEAPDSILQTASFTILVCLIQETGALCSVELRQNFQQLFALVAGGGRILAIRYWAATSGGGRPDCHSAWLAVAFAL